MVVILGSNIFLYLKTTLKVMISLAKSSHILNLSRTKATQVTLLLLIGIFHISTVGKTNSMIILLNMK